MKTRGSDRERRATRVAGVLIAGLALVACGEASEPAAESAPAQGSPVLARFGDGGVVTAEDLGPLGPRANGMNRLDALIRRRLVVEEALRRGLDKQEKVQAGFAEIERNATNQREALLRNAFFNSIRLAIPLSEEDVVAWYEQTKERYRERQWSLRMQAFPNEDAALAAAAALGPNGRLDPEKSEAPGPLPAEKLPQPVLPILHLLVQPGDRRIVPLDAWTIVELVEYLPDAQLPLEAVRPKVELSLQATRAEEQMRAEIERLRTQANVQIDEAALAAYAEEQAKAYRSEPATGAQ